jgi:hypothetical protein
VYHFARPILSYEELPDSATGTTNDFGDSNTKDENRKMITLQHSQSSDYSPDEASDRNTGMDPESTSPEGVTERSRTSPEGHSSDSVMRELRNEIKSTVPS